ncbi:phage major capsid protein [Brevibacillus brevis]|uniref:phage major capsid protein n=1 Tax=Brevibacillus brevis TaxID=1393 RepID=UPI000D100978|nr:phage major capsid protein [Brevibacillus brevis]PSJ66297.1 phage major capsid protein [Brevibacillus brevis]RED21807.1 HK97 family phage major capsid protein [Brevibacillus brevis]GEC92427.1 major capsid protein [Brevibacillus brevis]VEF92670.1 Predicted phage phi-C31 gp36 major capsid-like protein [Brevibacillus brevis]
MVQKTKAPTFRYNLQRFNGAGVILSSSLSGLIPEETSQEIIKDVVRGSTILKLAQLEPMTTETKKIPVFLDKPGAYWVGEGERIKTSTARWTQVTLTAKKLAVIIPMTKEALNRSRVDVFEELKPYVVEAFYTKLDAATIMGTETPFTSDILTAATKAGNSFTRGSVSGKNLADDVNSVMALIEADDQEPRAFAAHNGLKSSLRGLKNSNGDPLYLTSVREGVAEDSLYSLPIEYSRNGAWDKTKADLIAGDFKKAKVGILKDIEYEILKEATLQSITAADGKPLSLAEQDMVALKATFQVAFLVIKEGAFAVLRPTGFVPTP